MQDIITKEITVNAPQERVYNAIADPDQIVSWFPDAVEDGTFEVGQRPLLTFGNLKTRIYVESAKPFSYFSYRWVPGGVANTGDVLQVAHTLVEFFIEEQGDSTKVTLKESGFASLPAENSKASYEMMTSGWTNMMGRLEEKLNKQ